MSSQKQFDANRKNSGLSSGPKTVRGKNAVRYNAFKHGCYASELFALPEVQQEFARLEKELREQLKPDTPLQCIKFKEVVYCACQCELAARADMQRMNALLFPPDTKEPANGKAPLLEDWYGASPQSLRNAIRFLESLKQIVQERWSVPQELKEQVRKGFGARFADLLDPQSPPIGQDAVLLADFLLTHEKTFGRPLPHRSMEGPTDGSPKSVIDPQQRLQAILSLIDLMQQFMEDIRLLHSASEYQVARATASDSPPRHFTHATRALQRAIESYQYLVKNGF